MASWLDYRSFLLAAMNIVSVLNLIVLPSYVVPCRAVQFLVWTWRGRGGKASPQLHLSAPGELVKTSRPLVGSAR